jgi:DNA-binding response OmpR family regulator
MPDIFLLIPEPTLREAVVEQIKIAKLGVPCFLDSPSALPKRGDENVPSIVIIDETGSWKKEESPVRAFADYPEKPILLVLGGSDDIDGVTETFVKPFRLGHLISRLKYYIETAPLLRNSVITFGPWRLEPQTRSAVRENGTEPVRLTEKETALLIFMAHHRETSTRRDILAQVWGYDERIDTHTLETHIYQLRRKLDIDGKTWIVNDAGKYYLSGIKE